MSAHDSPEARARARADFVAAGLLHKMRHTGHLETAARLKAVDELLSAFDVLEAIRSSADAAETAPELPPST